MLGPVARRRVGEARRSSGPGSRELAGADRPGTRDLRRDHEAEREPHLGKRTAPIPLSPLRVMGSRKPATLAMAPVPDHLDDLRFLEVRLQRPEDLGVIAMHDRVAWDEESG